MFGQCNRNLRVVLLYGVYDIPAKNMVSGFVGHNGEYSCTRCLHPGKVLKTDKGQCCTKTCTCA